MALSTQPSSRPSVSTSHHFRGQLPQGGQSRKRWSRNGSIRFAGQVRATPWDPMHALSFASYANGNYFVAPFIYASPGFETRETGVWQERGETRRRLEVTYPEALRLTIRARIGSSTASRFRPSARSTCAKRTAPHSSKASRSISTSRAWPSPESVWCRRRNERCYLVGSNTNRILPVRPLLAALASAAR
jgi:hypothetical protein